MEKTNINIPQSMYWELKSIIDDKTNDIEDITTAFKRAIRLFVWFMTETKGGKSKVCLVEKNGKTYGIELHS